MLKAEIVEAVDIERAAAVFDRDGFVCVSNPMNEEQFALNRSGAERVMRGAGRRIRARKNEPGVSRVILSEVSCTTGSGAS